MTTYRIYLVGPDGRLRLGETFEARDDAEARARLGAVAPAGQSAELWASGRLVGQLSRTGKFQAGP
jgi:hypothetical protein